MADYLQKVHIFESNESYQKHKEEIGKNDLALVKDTDVDNYNNVGVMENGINPDVLVANGTLLAGTGLNSAEGQAYKNVDTAVTPIASENNKNVSLSKAWLVSNEPVYKYLVFLCGVPASGFTSPMLVVVPTKDIMNNKKLFQKYVGDGTKTTSLSGNKVSIASIFANHYLAAAFYGTGISALGQEIVFFMNNSYKINVYAIYGINSLGA